MSTARSTRRPPWILPVIVAAQLACTSLWFAGNAVLPDLQAAWGLSAASMSGLMASVQIGFVLGTLTFAILSVSDRFRASSVFFVCALLGAVSNLAVAFVCDGATSLFVARLLTGFFLAGIYPVGMKIAASWCEHGLGRALGYLVGALVVGTALPHLLRGVGAGLDWRSVIVSCSAVAALGGWAIHVAVPPGPHLPARSPFDIGALPAIFRQPRLRAAAFGYFGHMWELYAFWAFAPFLIHAYVADAALADVNVPIASFCVIAAGAIGCVIGGELANRFGSARIALAQLSVSGAACLLLPFVFHAGPVAFLIFMLIWGTTVVGDSPQFSSLVGSSAPREYVGTAFTIVNGIGFAITALSIQLLGVLSAHVPAPLLFLFLAPGPILGLCASRRLLVADL